MYNGAGRVLCATHHEQVQTMVKKSADCSDVRSVSIKCMTEKISLSMQWSSRKFKWTAKWRAKWTSLCLFSKFRSKFRRSGAPTVSASLRLKLPRAILRLNLRVRSSVSSTNGSTSTSTLQKTAKFFGTFKTRKFRSGFIWYLRKLKEKTFLRAGCDPSGGVPREEVGSAPRWKLVKLDHLQQQIAVGKSFSDLATWFCRGHLRRWEGPLTRLPELMGNLPPLSHFYSEKERLVSVVQAGIVFFTLILSDRLRSAGAASRTAFTATASVVVLGLVLNFLNSSVLRFGNSRRNSSTKNQNNFFILVDRFHG